MESRDLDLIRQHVPEDNQLGELYKEHVDYEKRLAKLDNKLFLTPEEETLRKELQKKKLKGKDLIETILSQYRGRAKNQ